MQLSARNQPKGRVRSVTPGDIMAEVVVDVGGQEMVAAITRGSVESLNIQDGDDIIVVVKATEVMPAKQ
jgi:molybdopterin-binding protein